MSKGLEKYLQEAEQHCALEVNYFDDNTRHTGEEPNLKDAGQTIQPSKSNQISSKQMSIEDIKAARNTPESPKSDTGHTSRQHSKVPTDADEKCQQITTLEDIKPHTDAKCHDEKHPDEEIAREPTSKHIE